MDIDDIIFITKDAFCKDYLPCYGNQYWSGHTPNIDKLVEKGSMFSKCYTGAPSTVMSNMCMFTGLYSHESELSRYLLSGIHYQGETLWTKAEAKGYECHIIWDEAWHSVFKMEERYYCYGENTKIHHLKEIRQGVGAHYLHGDSLKRDDSKTEYVYKVIKSEIKKIKGKAKKPIFLWMHIPHVINGRIGYGTDIDAFDHIVGIARNEFKDNNIFIAADHGNMNGVKGKISYGHDVYETVVNIPFITPRITDKRIIDNLVSNIDISTIIFDRKIPERKVIYSDSTFYAQPNRKLAIITKDYKYIYNKHSKKEELYDLRTDPAENCNLISDIIYDVDRHVKTPLRELYFYPYWDELEDVRRYFREEKKKIWKTGTFKEEFIPTLKFQIQTHGYYQLTQILSKLRSKRRKR